MILCAKEKSEWALYCGFSALNWHKVTKDGVFYIMTAKTLADIAAILKEIHASIERAVPPLPKDADLSAADAFVWHAEPVPHLQAVMKVNRVELSLLKAVDRNRDMILENTQRFAEGLPANNALLWGARGMGKSSLVKACHAAVNKALEGRKSPLKLIEIAREDIDSLPSLMNILRAHEERCILFCDDLSFDPGETAYKSLKAVLDGGIEGRPDNVLFYATSNRRHLMPRDMIENERSTSINPSEAVQEKVSLSDRFGLWIGFHNCSQDDYLSMVNGYVEQYGIKVDPDQLRASALEWSTTRGSRSGRVAWQFIQDLAGEKGVKLR